MTNQAIDGTANKAPHTALLVLPMIGSAIVPVSHTPSASGYVRSADLPCFSSPLAM